MKIIKKTIQLFLIAAIASVSFAGEQSVKAQSSVMPVAIQCVSLGSNFGIGNFDVYAGGQVNALQTYLYQNGYMTHVPTGYYGGLTASAVANFQRANGIQATGYVGPLTRARLQAVTCGGPIISQTSISSLSPYAGPIGSTVYIDGTSLNNGVIYFGGMAMNTNTAFVGTTSRISFVVPNYITPCPPNANCIQMAQQVMPGVYPIYVRNSDGSVSNTVNFTVTGSGTTQQFSIAGVDAPSTLTYNNVGTWTIRVNNSGGNLRYSVVWGDEYPMSYNASIAAPSQTYQSSATFTHSYSQTGTYHPTFTVTDDAGRTATISTSVVVTPIYYY